MYQYPALHNSLKNKGLLTNHSPNSYFTSVQLQFTFSFILLQTPNKKVGEFRRPPLGFFFVCFFFLCQVPFLPLCICSLAWNSIYQLYIKLISSTTLREVLHRPMLATHIKLCHQLLGLSRGAQTQQFN